MPKAIVLADAGLNGHRITALKDQECVGTAIRLYDEYLRGDEAVPINLDALGRYLIAIAGRAARRGT
jgi:hypothetical protein